MEYVNLMKEHIAQVLLTIGKNVELSLCRIVQLASTVGIHAIIATQRPTKNIISGTIKANFPTRLSFRMACLMDSRLVIDRSGAQQLTAPGDVKHISEQHGQACYYPLPKVEAIV